MTDTEQQTEQPADLKPIPIRIVAYEGDAGLTLANGELRPTPETAGDVAAVKRSLAVLLRALADELEADADKIDAAAGS